ncbi:MAG: glycoside hydrolase family 73 protein, partial [Flavobacteriales bacterium]
MLNSLSFMACVWMLVFGTTTLVAQHFPNINYILKYKAMALSEMRSAKIPASITLAQGILESENGRSFLATEGYNHFGIKCKSHYVGKAIFRTDDAENECFRVYESVRGSYRDHSNFLVKNQRYAFLFDYKLTDYKAWAKGLKKAGYATNPRYADILIRIIHTNALHLLDVSEKK